MLHRRVEIEKQDYRKEFARIGIIGYDYNWSLLASSGV
jgi:hypothetical protein